MSPTAPADPLVRPAVTPGQAGSRRLPAVLAILLAFGSLWLGNGPSQQPATLVVLDLSQSMRAGKPPRYELARQQTETFLDQVPGPVGLITCAARARLAAPITLDTTGIRQKLANLPREAAHPDLSPEPTSVSGTRLATGLTLARSILEKRSDNGRVILISDGDDPVKDDSANQEAERLAATGIRLIVVPVGREGTRETIPAEGAELSWKGAPVLSEVHLPYLESIAHSGNGQLISQIQALSTSINLPENTGIYLLAGSLLCWIWFLADPFRLSARNLLALAAIAQLTSCEKTPEGLDKSDQSDPAAWLLRAQSMEPTDPARALVALQAETLARQALQDGIGASPDKLSLLQALVQVGESVPMDRKALLEARELALECAEELGPDLDPWLRLIRWRLAQCPTQPGTQSTETSQGGDGPADQTGDPGGTADLPKRAGKSERTSRPPKAGDQETPGQGIPGAARLPVVLDDREPQPLGPDRARQLLRSALERDPRKSRVPASWSRSPGEIPDW